MDLQTCRQALNVLALRGFHDSGRPDMFTLVEDAAFGYSLFRGPKVVAGREEDEPDSVAKRQPSSPVV